MQNAAQGSSSVSVTKKIGEESEKSSTPQSSPTGSGADTLDEPRPKFMSDSSESEEEDVSEVESFMIEQDVDDRLDGSKFLLSGACADAVDPETQERLEALLQAAGIGRLSAGDGKHLADPEVLRRLTSSVSCALDEAAAALTRMRTDHPRPTTDTRSLVEACSDGDVSTVRKLLTEGGKSVHETNEEGESLLSLACSAGYLELAQVLIAMSANVEDRGVKGDCTPLMEAASAGHVDIVALLLNHNAQVNAQSASGNTALMYACAGGHEDVVKVLLECAANVEDHNENGHTPLMEAASAGHVGVAQILLNYGAGINTHSNEFKESALTLACYKGHLDMVRFLLEAGADQEHKTDEMHTALMEASMDGHVEVARLLLDSGAQVNMPTDSFESPLTLAACGGHTELAMLLIERGANIEEVNDEGYTPLMEAAREGHEDMVALLLSQGANINAQTEETQETALTLACCGGFLEVADFLLKAGADLEAGASTPLMEAAQEGHLDLVRYLLEYHHAQVNAQTQTGDTALTYACENGHTDVASLLLLYGADLEHESEGGRTPLMKACRAGHTYTVQYLISKNADVNKTTSNNDHTPLSLAATGGHLAVVELLLANRADPFHRLKDNSTMVIEAAKGGHTNVVHLLLDYPHSVMIQATADGEVRKIPLVAPAAAPAATPAVASPAAPTGVPAVAPEPEEPGPPPAPTPPGPVPGPIPAAVPAAAPPGAPVTSSAPGPMVQVQRSLLRKLRPPTTAEPGLTSAEAQQVRSQPVGELAAEGEVEEKPESPQAGTDIAMQYGANQPFQVSQNTAISDRPKAKPFSKKDGKTLRKILSQPLQPPQVDALQTPQGAQPPLGAAPPATPQPAPQPAQPGHQPPTEAVALDKRGNVYHVQQLDGTAPPQLQLKHQQVWMLQHPVDEQDLPADGSKAKDAADQIDTLVMDFAHKLEAFSLDDVTNAEQERLILRARQQLSPEEALAADEEAYNLLSQQQQDLTYITVPTITGHQNQRSEQGLHVQYQYAHQLAQLVPTGVDVNGLEITSTPLQLPGTNGQPITVTRTTEGNIQITGSGGQMQLCGPNLPTKLGHLQAYADGFQLGVAHAINTPAPGVVPGLSLPPRLMGAAGYPPQLLLPSPPLSSATSPAFCCPNVPAPLEPPPARTQVQVATQTTTEKKGQPMYPPLKGKKLRFPQPGQRAGTYAVTGQPDAAGLAQCSGTFPAQCGAPTPPLQLSACMDVDSETDSNHDTALTLACAGGHEELVELLLSRGADIEHRDKKGFTPLILAATAGHEKVVEILLNHGADIEAQSERTKDTPLSLACSGGRYEVVELLLNKMANKEHRNVSDYTPLSLAASGGYVNIIKLLLNHGAEINSRTGSKLGISPLMLASMNGHVAAVKLLLDMGSDINAQIETNRNTALTLACFQGRHEVVSLLLDRKANVEHRAKTGLTPLMEAASGGYVDVGRVLIDKGADVNASPVPSSRDTALTIAADKGHVRFVELLLSRNAMVEVKNKKGNSPLWLAANGGHLAVVELLYNLDADIDSQDNRKVSCLMAAFRKGHVKVVKWMVNHVTQFPSDQEMTRFIATISDKELLDKCHECVKVIRAAKDLQSAKANKNASILLEELDMEKTREESKKAAAARRRERKKKKKLEKKEERRKLYEENQKPESDDEEDDGDGDGDGDIDPGEARVNEARKAERLGSTSPVADKEEGDSGIDANSQGSCSSNDVKSKETGTKRKEKKKKKGADKLTDVSPPKPSQLDSKERSSDRRVAEQPANNADNSASGRLPEKMRDSLAFDVAVRVQQERDAQRHPADREDFEATGNETYVPASKGRKTNSNYQNHHEPETVAKTTTTSPKGTGKREEGWKEVVRNFPYRSKKVSVPLNAISRVIGRGGSNINAIRAATGAHIEVEKQGKGQGERIITIKGSADATKQAHNLIAVLIKDPDVDIVQMLPKSVKTGANIGSWEKPTVVAVSKSKTGNGKVSSGVSAAPLAAGIVKQPVVALAAAKMSQAKLSLTQPGQTLPTKANASRILTAVEMKRSAAGATKTTMSYTSAIMTSGRASKPVAATPVPAGANLAPGAKPRTVLPPAMAAVLSTPAPPATAPVSPQVSPPQPVPPSPKHHRPQPTSSAPPSMQQGQMPGKPVTQLAANHHLQQQQQLQQQHQQQHNQHMQFNQHQHDLLTHNLLQEYSLFNDGFSKNNMWGRDQEASKLNFASVAATGAPPGSKFLDEMPAQVDVTKAPGYRGNSVCSPVSKPPPFCSPSYPEPRSHDPSSSPRGGEPAVHGQMNMLPPMQLDVSGHVSGPIGPPLFGPRGGYSEPALYHGDMVYQMQASPPPPAVAMSRLNPRAPDFSFGAKPGMARPGRWAYGPGQQELVFPPGQSVSDLLTNFDNGLAPSPSMSPSSPIQAGLAPGEMKVEDRKIPRPIGTERNWKNNAAVLNGYDHLDQGWLEGKAWQAAAFRPSPTTGYRNLHEELGLMDASYQGAMSEVQYHNGTALAQQLMMAQQQVPLQIPPLDPSKLDPTGWDVDKHAGYSEGWTSTKWTH